MEKTINNTNDFINLLREIDRFSGFEIYFNDPDVFIKKDRFLFMYIASFKDKDGYIHSIGYSINDNHLSFKRLINFLIKHKKIKYPLNLRYF